MNDNYLSMGITILFLLLSASFLYLIFTSAILIRNRYELTELPDQTFPKEHSKKISVCIPARNEEKTIGTLLRSVFEQTYPNFEVHVLDDRSTDKTAAILENFKKDHPETLFIHRGKPKPEDWLGKPWACQQLGQKASGNYLLFLDADTQLKPGALQMVSNGFDRYGVDMLTVWPHQILKGFWEKTVIPLVYYALLTLLPVIYAYRKPRWMPLTLYKMMREHFAAANGQCIAFTKNAYKKIGGHESVKNEIVEDVALARQIKKMELKLRMFSGINSVSCRMYHTEEEMFEGFRKNFLAGFGNNLLLFIIAAILHLVVFIVPFIVLFAQLFLYHPILFFQSSAVVTLILVQRLIVTVWFRWDPLYVFLHPLGVLWFQRLGITKIFDRIKKRKPAWKGRTL